MKFIEFIDKLTPKFIKKLDSASDSLRHLSNDLSEKMYFGTDAETLAAKAKLQSSPKLMTNVINEDRQEAFREKGLLGGGDSKGFKEIFYHFFGMNETWPFWRNLLGGAMVHCPEWPTYFIPAYTQAKATGDAGDLKKGEGVRGLITGGLEGIAVGALVSGLKLKPKEMGPYIVLGAALQLVSSKVFPWMGEKMGQYEYNKKRLENAKSPINNTEIKLPVQDKPAVLSVATANSKPAFKGKAPYSNQFNGLYTNKMKI